MASRYELAVSNLTPTPRKLFQVTVPETLKGSPLLGNEKTTVVLVPLKIGVIISINTPPGLMLRIKSLKARF